MNVESEIEGKLKSIVGDLVSKKYRKIIDAGIGNRLQASWIEKVIDEYPGQLTLPPDIAYESFDLYMVKGQQKWIVEFFL